MARLPIGLAISRWTKLEFASLLARDVLMGGVNAGEARAVKALFVEVVAGSVVVWLRGAAELAKAVFRRRSGTPA
jgi:uncharacterized protein